MSQPENSWHRHHKWHLWRQWHGNTTVAILANVSHHKLPSKTGRKTPDGVEMGHSVLFTVETVIDSTGAFWCPRFNHLTDFRLTMLSTVPPDTDVPLTRRPTAPSSHPIWPNTDPYRCYCSLMICECVCQFKKKQRTVSCIHVVSSQTKYCCSLTH